MKFTLSWLRDHLDTDAPLDALLAALNRIGLEVEAVTDRGAALVGFRTARILAAEPHPNADRLRVCRVDIGQDGAEPVQVVCGAPNARAGISVIFAPPGIVIPSTGATLRTGEIRASRAAVCCARFANSVSARSMTASPNWMTTPRRASPTPISPASTIR